MKKERSNFPKKRSPFEIGFWILVISTVLLGPILFIVLMQAEHSQWESHWAHRPVIANTGVASKLAELPWPEEPPGLLVTEDRIGLDYLSWEELKSLEIRNFQVNSLVATRMCLLYVTPNNHVPDRLFSVTVRGKAGPSPKIRGGGKVLDVRGYSKFLEILDAAMGLKRGEQQSFSNIFEYKSRVKNLTSSRKASTFKLSSIRSTDGKSVLPPELDSSLAQIRVFRIKEGYQHSWVNVE
ncbi:MAG: hypothetical protein MUC92_01930 [Fimbriimonadaceae bacterium]|jgi:hypothetical protein|nr:hypothetical protein [Fimbriimonadaceae bacterium]